MIRFTTPPIASVPYNTDAGPRTTSTRCTAFRSTIAGSSPKSACRRALFKRSPSSSSRMRWPRWPRIVGRVWFVPTPFTSRPGSVLSRSAAVLGVVSRTSAESSTATGAAVAKTSFGERVTVTLMGEMTNGLTVSGTAVVSRRWSRSCASRPAAGARRSRHITRPIRVPRRAHAGPSRGSG